MKVRIFSKETGSNPDVWGVEIQGRRGYVNKIHIKEEQTIISSSKLIRVPTELLKTEGVETPATETATISPLPGGNDKEAAPVVNDFSTKIEDENAASSYVPAEKVASSSNPNVAQLTEDASKTTSSTPSVALNSNSETKTDATPAVAGTPVNEPLVIKKDAYVTTATEKPMLSRQDNVNDTEEVQLEVIAPFADSSKADQVAQPVPPTFKSTITVDPSKIPSYETQPNSIDSKDPIPNASIANEKLEPSTLKKTLPSSNVVPNIVTESPSQGTETANLTTAAPVLASTTPQVEPAKIAPQAAVTTTNASGPAISAAVTAATDTTVSPTTTTPPTTTSPPIESTRPADNSAVPTISMPKTDDSVIINNGTPSTDFISGPLPQIINKTDHLNSSEDITTNIPSSPAVVSKVLHIDPITEAKILLEDDDLNSTDTSSEDYNTLMDDSVEDYENTTDSIQARDSSETIAPADEDTKATPPPFIDPYKSLKNQDSGYPITDLPVSNEVVTPPSPPIHHDHKYPAGGKTPFYPTQKPYFPTYPSTDNSAEVKVETAQSVSGASSEVVQVPNEVETPISVNNIHSVTFERVTSDSVAAPEGVGNVEQILPLLVEVPPEADLTIEDNAITETETIDDGPGVFSNFWNSITGLFDNSGAPEDSQLQQDAIDFQQKMNDMFTTPEEAAAAKPAIVGE